MDRLLSALDKNGEVPTFYIAMSKQRGPGKSYSASKFVLNRYFDTNGEEEFVLLCRNVGMLGGLAKGVLNSYLEEEHPAWTVREVVHTSKAFSNIYIDIPDGDEKKTYMVGYCIPLKKAGDIKNLSSTFKKVGTLFFDEVMPDKRMGQTFLKGEIGVFRNLYKSIARGGGSAVRYVRCILCSNTINIDNPYLRYLDGGMIGKINKDETRWYAGESVVFERCEVEGLDELHKAQGIDRALAKWVEEEENNIWIADDDSLVVKKKQMEGWGRGYYVATLLYDKDYIGIYAYDRMGYTYLSRNYDKTCPDVYCVNIDGTPNISVLKTSKLIDSLQKDFYKGMVRVSDSGIQEMLMELFA